MTIHCIQKRLRAQRRDSAVKTWTGQGTEGPKGGDSEHSCGCVLEHVSFANHYLHSLAFPSTDWFLLYYIKFISYSVVLKGFLELKLKRRVAALCFLSSVEGVHVQMIGLIFLSQLLTPSKSLFTHWQWCPPRRDGSATDLVGNVRMDLAEWIFLSGRCLKCLAQC